MNGFVVVINSSPNVKSVDELWMDLQDSKSNQVCHGSGLRIQGSSTQVPYLGVITHQNQDHT